MRLNEFGLFTDENIHPAVLQFLRSQGFDVRDVKERGRVGTPDDELLRLAGAEQRVFVTHDRDFGSLAIARFQSMVGIVYLRPGHIDASFTIGSLQALFNENLDYKPPFLVVVRRTLDDVKIRLRHF